MSVLCTAITSKGTTCKRHALEESLFCRQHAPTPTLDAPIVNPGYIPCSVAGCQGSADVEKPDGTQLCYEHAALVTTAMFAPIVNDEEESIFTPDQIEALRAYAESAPIVSQDEPIKRDTSHAYQNATTPMVVVVPRKDSPKKNPVVKRADRDQDVAYFDNVLKKRKDIRQYVMPEYFACPAYWVPTLKLKPGESLGERLERDYNAWLKSYARALRDRKVSKINGVFFYPAKITPGAFLELIRAGQRAYCLEYAKNSKLFGDDPRATIATLVGIAIDFPLVSAVLETASAYHKEHGRKNPVQDDVDSAMEAFKAAFKAAHEALRLIDTGAQDESATITAGAIVSEITA